MSVESQLQTIQQHREEAGKDETEASIIINGVKLTVAQAMTVRCACTFWDYHLRTEGLCDDDSGKEIIQAYLDRLDEILVITISGKTKPRKP